MAFTLAPDIHGTGLVVHDTIGSTSADAMEQLRAGADAPFWVVTDHQSAGRGRRGAAWSTDPGNLAASVALRLDLPPAVIATLGFVAGVAIVRALDNVARISCAAPSALAGEGGRGIGRGRMRDVGAALSSVTASPGHLLPQGEKVGAFLDGSAQVNLSNDPRFRLKWPNDVLADGAKLVGILLETEETRHGRAVVVGIGVNVRHAPAGLAYRTASLEALGVSASAEDLFEALSACWAEALTVWEGGRGFPAIRSAWLERAAGLGGPVTVRLGGDVVAGTFETIDPQGQLVVRLPDGGARAISAGDVHLGNAASLRAEAVA